MTRRTEASRAILKLICEGLDLLIQHQAVRDRPELGTHAAKLASLVNMVQGWQDMSDSEWDATHPLPTPTVQ